VRLGWSHGDQEFFTVDEMVRLFDITEVNKSASAFNVEKLAWLNQQHIMRALPARIVPPLRWQLERHGVQANDDAQLEQIVLAQRERSKTLREMADNSVFFFRAPTAYDDKGVRKHVSAETLPLFIEAADVLAELEGWTPATIHEVLSAVVARHASSLGKLAQPLRLAVCGSTISPPIDITLAILGKEESLRRLARARAVWTLAHSFS
jgi:glutamyl-tRNA synthetase